MYKNKPSVVIINGINALGFEIAQRFNSSSQVLIVGNLKENSTPIPKNISVIDFDLFSTIKLSKIKNIIILYHEISEDMVSAHDLVNHAKFLSDIFNVGTLNNAKIVLTTSFIASKQYIFAKYNDKDQPYDFPSMQNFIEKLTLEQGRKSPVYILRVGDVYGVGMSKESIIYRMVKDAVSGNFVRVDDDGLDKIYPISQVEIANNIYRIFNTEIKKGIYTLVPQDGITQLSFANMCIQYSKSVSYIKFLKSKHQLKSDPMYENIYSPAPFLNPNLDISELEKDLLLLVKNINPETMPALRSEKIGEKFKTDKQYIKKVKKNNMVIMNYVVTVILMLLVILLVIIPVSLSLINTKLLSDGNNIFINNYNKSLTAELTEDSRFNKQKAGDLVGVITLSQWLLPILGDDFKSNQNFLEAERDYFEALSYSKDYKFLTVPDASRSLVQIKLQSAQSHLKSVEKEKLFWELQSRFDEMCKIINDASL